MSARETLAIVLRREHLRSTVAIALVVGSVLMLINHFDTIVAGEATRTTWLKVALTYSVPFVVSNLGLLAGKRAELESDQPEPTRDEAARDRGEAPI